jgi:2-polyprenyl-3-methyl-5-hydroxy-6-metoxy-1,4-benzoquinol methylase
MTEATVLAENTYGDAKRLRFVDAVIAERRPARVLDVGCGSGELLTAPLAARHPDIGFTGVDSDACSLAHAAARHRLANLRFLPFAALAADRVFELVIASEVLEHVEEPHAFLRDLRQRLAPAGVLVLTVPNGYGPAEIGQVAEALLRVSGLFRLARAIWRGLGL